MENFEKFKQDLKNSGIDFDKMSLEKMKMILRAKSRILNKNRYKRKLMLDKGLSPVNQTKFDFNKAFGGALAVRFGALPRVVIVKQQPEYIKVKLI